MLGHLPGGRKGNYRTPVLTNIAQDALYCVYIAPDEQAIREHGKPGGFPVTRVSKIAGAMDPTTAEVPVRVG